MIALSAGLAQAAPDGMAFTVSMPQPATHTLHVTFRCDGLKGELQDFKMPVWSPGFYGIGDYSRNVSTKSSQKGVPAAGRFAPASRLILR
jgi:hypothetical protein